MKNRMEELFKESGVNIDLSKINLGDDEQDIAAKVFAAMDEAMSGMEDAPPNKPKSKREIQKEQEKAQELEALQKKELSSIYKQLAKEFHPDLEQDEAKG